MFLLTILSDYIITYDHVFVTFTSHVVGVNHVQWYENKVQISKMFGSLTL